MPALNPVTLEGDTVTLVPLDSGHLDALARVGLDPSLWEFTVSIIRTPADLAEWMQAALDERRAGTAMPFVTTLRHTGEVVGSTRLATWSSSHRRVEIGWTWVGTAWQRTRVNTEAKYLMLRHAFDTLQCNRVELKTDALNQRSRTAILRLGATEEGVLRQHQVTASGRVRDTVYFSILQDDWPVVRARLEARLAAAAD